MRKIVFTILLAIPMCMQAQLGLVSAVVGSAAAAAASANDPSVPEREVRVVSGYQKFINRQGDFIKYIDVELPDIDRAISGSTVNAKVRTVIGEQENGYFLQLKYSFDSRLYYVELSDLKKIVQAMKKLAKDFESDEKLQPDFLKNYYRGDDGFIVGYTLAKPKWKMNWYVDIPFLKGDKLYNIEITVKDPDVFYKQLEDALTIMEELKSKAGK